MYDVVSKELISRDYIILLFVYAVNFNIFNELLVLIKYAIKHIFIIPNFVEMIESNYLNFLILIPKSL